MFALVLFALWQRQSRSLLYFALVATALLALRDDLFTASPRQFDAQVTTGGFGKVAAVVVRD